MKREEKEKRREERRKKKMMRTQEMEVDIVEGWFSDVVGLL